MISEELLDEVYQAAVFPDRWPRLLENLATHVGSFGGLVFVQSNNEFRWIGSPNVEPVMADYMAEGWGQDATRIAPLLAARYPGFVTDLDHHHSPEALAQIPVYAEFLLPRGLGTGAATSIQGAENDAIVMSLEGFESPQTVRKRIPVLNALRPHLARAVSLSARISLERSQAMVTSFAALNIPAAVLDDRGRLRAANAGFHARLTDEAIERRERFTLRDRRADTVLSAALAPERVAQLDRACSFAVLPSSTGQRFAMHLIPLAGASRDCFDGNRTLLLVADGRNTSLPNADLLQALFDLTPAEARVARSLLEGRTLIETAKCVTVSVQTVRAQLKAIFQKTGVTRQADLIRQISSFGPFCD